VDHVIEECRTPSIIRHSIHKRFAIALPVLSVFGHVTDDGDHKPDVSLFSAKGRMNKTGGSTSNNRADDLSSLVVSEGRHVRGHMSHQFAPDPMEHWGQEEAKVRANAFVEETMVSSQKDIASSVEDAEMEAANLGVVQTQSESAGNLGPTYEWVPWDRAIPHGGRWVSFVMYVAGAAIFAFLATLVTSCWPAARGSGIPDVKANVAGFYLPASFQLQTLAAKMPGLALCVGAGLAVGKEGPMIHIGACWGSLLAGPVSAVLGRRCPSRAQSSWPWVPRVGSRQHLERRLLASYLPLRSWAPPWLEVSATQR
jgi:hypothetical protein